MVSIYHNTRCSKSNKTLEILKAKLTPKKIPITIIDYLSMPPSESELKQLISRLGVGVRDVIRTDEHYYHSLKLDNVALSEDKLIEILVRYPILIQRPIVISPKGVVIARPPEKVLEIL